MGCETECERENQEGPGETKGDTEKLSKILSLWGENRCFLCFLVGAHQPKKLRKKGKKKITCHMLQTRVIKKPYVATPLLTKNWWFATCIVVKEEQWWLFNVKPGKIKKKKKGLEAQRQETPKNEQGKTKNIFNWIYGCSYVIKREHTPKKQKERDKNSKTNEDRKPEKKQRIDDKRKHCNSIVRCCSFSWKQSQKNKKKEGDSKTRKTTSKKNKENNKEG